MKIAIIGGAGVRTPLLVSGLTTSDLPIDEIALYDINQSRLHAVAALARTMCARGRVVEAGSLEMCVADSDYVFASIRVGGIERRAADEAAAQRHGIIGQETVGPAGFAMAARTIPVMVDYARAIAAAAPRAWIINFTNPVGMVTEAMRTVTDRIVGICDTPTELFEATAHALDLSPARCAFDYFGLNHLGWLREVYSDGEGQLHRLWSDDARLRAIYRAPVFDPEYLRRLRLLPTEYVYYYEQPRRAFESVNRSGRTRAQTIAELTRSFFDGLRRSGDDSRAPADVVALYRGYLQSRSAGYMQLETGSAGAVATTWQPELSGYDKIAVAVVRAMHFDSNAVIPLSVPNRGNMPGLSDDDVVEVPCVVNANGARALHVGAVPGSVRAILERVKTYERLTVRAARARSVDDARRALAVNPLVPNQSAADALIDDLQPLW